MVALDGKQLHNAAEYLRGRIQAVPTGRSSADLRTREAHFDVFRRTRRNALALWSETVGLQGPVDNACEKFSTDRATFTVRGGSSGEGDKGVPCLLWCSGRWNCANAGWCNEPGEERLKVSFPGYDDEAAVFVSPEDPRLRRALLDPRCGRDHPNTRVLKGIFPKTGDHVRVHIIDAAEASVFLQEGLYLAGAITCPLAIHDSCLVSVVGLAGEESFLVPNTRMEHVTSEDYARVVKKLKIARNQVLRQLDIATSQTIAIEVVSGVGEVLDDKAPISLWALGDQLLIRVWQRKGAFMLSTSVSASEALAAVGMDDMGLTVLSEADRRQLLGRVRDRIRIAHGILEMDMDVAPSFQDNRHSASTGSPAEVHRETQTLEGIPIETVVERIEHGNLRVRSSTLRPGPERTYNMIAQPEDWAPLGYPSLLWLDDCRTACLARELTRCVSARDGDLVLQIGRDRMLSAEGFIPMQTPLQPSLSRRTCSRLPVADATSKALDNQHEHKDVSSCASGASPGLCSCRIVLRTGVSLPLSVAEAAGEVDHGDNSTGGEATDISGTALAPSRGRWLVTVTATGGDLALSLLRPSRAGQPNAGPSGQSPAAGGRGEGAGSEGGTCQGPAEQRRMMRRPRLLVATWSNWARLGYGPLQWMSHAQKEFIARLSLFWVSLKAPTGEEHCLKRDGHKTKEAFIAPEEAFLHFSPILSGMTRVVRLIRGDIVNGSGVEKTVPFKSSSGTSKEECSTLARVSARDGGSVLRLEVVVGEGKEVQRLGETFGKEEWQETGLEDLLWLDCSCRQYLAHRLVHQVVIAASHDEVRADGQRTARTSNELAKRRLVVVSDLPLPYWRGTVVLARLGSHAAGVFVTITDAGRRFQIEARDFEGGPVLAASTVSLEAWTEATGMAALMAPADDTTLKSILEDQLATLLSAGFRSGTIRLEKKRLARKVGKKQGGESGKWRGTFLSISGMEKGPCQVEGEGNDSDSETSDASTNTNTTKEPQRQKKQRSGLPPLSPTEMSPLEQKRALRLEMLSRMIDDFHSKHGHRGGDGVKTRNKRVTPDYATASRISGNCMDMTTGDQEEEFSTAVGDDCERNGDKIGVTLPAIAPSLLSVPNRNFKGAREVAHRRSVLSGDTSITDRSSSICGDGVSRIISSTQVAPLHICICCGGEGGIGHGRRCEHTFRRCGACRVEEVKLVLGIRRTKGGFGGTTATRAGQVPKLHLGDGGAEPKEEEFDWITDSDEQDPEFECDSCARIIEEVADRYHCETCDDYDLCQACFLSHKVASGPQSQSEDGLGKKRHVASHNVTRIIAKLR